MPIYEYRCQDCGAEFEELLLSTTRETAVRCHTCDGRRVGRVLSAFAVSSGAEAAVREAGPCGACGAAQRGMCGID
jgi:putative FmdB family regulatory protein